MGSTSQRERVPYTYDELAPQGLHYRSQRVLVLLADRDILCVLCVPWKSPKQRKEDGELLLTCWALTCGYGGELLLAWGGCRNHPPAC